MSGTQRRRAQAAPEDGASFLGLVPFGAGVFLAVLVVQALLRPPGGDPVGTARMASVVLGAVGALTALAFALGCAVLGVRWFLAGRPAAFWSHVTGIAGVALSLALIAGGVVAGAGGSLGNTFPRLIGPPIGAILGVLFGLATLAATLHLSWLQGSTALQPFTRALADRFAARLFQRRHQKPSGLERRPLVAEGAHGVSPAEARALLPDAGVPDVSDESFDDPFDDDDEESAAITSWSQGASSPEQRSPAPPFPYPADVKKHGGIPAGAVPLAPAPSAQASASAPHRDEPASDPIEPSTVYRWTPGGPARARIPADEDLAAPRAEARPTAPALGAAGPAEARPAPERLPAAGLTPAPSAPEVPPPADVTRGQVPRPLAARPVPPQATPLAAAARPSAAPPRPRWERAAPLPVETEPSAPSTEANPLAAGALEAGAGAPAEEDELVALERDLEASVRRFEQELAGVPAEADELEGLDEDEDLDEDEELEEAAALDEDDDLDEDVESEEESDEDEVLAEAAEFDEPELDLDESDEEVLELEEVVVAVQLVPADPDEPALEADELEVGAGLELAAQLPQAVPEVTPEPQPEPAAELEPEAPVATEPAPRPRPGRKSRKERKKERFAPALRGSGARLAWISDPTGIETATEPELSEAPAAEAAAVVQRDLFAAAPEEEAELGASEPLEEPEHVLVPQASADPAGALKNPSRLAIDAADLILERERVAVSMLQRQFGIDFEECCAVLDELQEHGFLGPYLGGQRRDILMTREQWLAHLVGQE